MTHTIQIPDELWARYDGSPMRMRDALWAALVEPRQETNGTAALSETPSHEGRVPWGTLFFALRRTTCPRCMRRIDPGELAVMTDYAHAGGRAIHFACAKDADLDLRWTRETLNSGFRQLLEKS